MADRGLNAARDAITHRGGWVLRAVPTLVGTPDLIACYRGVFLAVELKAPTDRPSRIQRFRHTEIRAAGGVVVVAYQTQDVYRALDRIDASQPVPDRPPGYPPAAG